MNTAWLLWKRSRPVPTGERHPARRWAARRHLVPPGDPFPDSIRWTVDPEGRGSLVACFAPVPDWRAEHPPAPTGVQLVHVGDDGGPRTDAGGLGKRSHGTLTGAVCVTGSPLWRGEPVHVAEGIDAALAITAREHGAGIAAGGKPGPKLAPALAALGVPVTVWPDRDDDGSGRIAAAALVRLLRQRGAVAVLADVPAGEDPASMGGPFNPPSPA